MKIPPGFSAKVAAAHRVARRKLLAQRILWIAEQPDWTAANHAFGAMTSRKSGDPHATAVLASATVSAARKAEKHQRWVIAARVWVWFVALSGDLDKGSRNIAVCARNLTRERHDRESVASALEAWRLLAGIDPKSDSAVQGLIWCHATLARHSEDVGDMASAVAQWSAVLNISPEHAAATEGLRRVLERQSEERVSSDPAHVSPRAQALYRRLSRTTGSDYRSQCGAALRMLQAGAPQLAFEFAEKAFNRRPGNEAALLLFRCCIALGRYPEAAAALNASPEAIRIQTVSYDEVHHLLTKESVESLTSDVLTALAQREDAAQFAPALLPRLIDRDLRQHVLAFADRSHAVQGWPTPVTLRAADYLWQSGHPDRALRLLAGSSQTVEIAESFLLYAVLLEPENIEEILLAETPAPPAGSLLLLAELHQRRGNLERSADFLCRAGDFGAAKQFYRANKIRIAALMTTLLSAGPDSTLESRLATLLANWASEAVKSFFASASFARLCEDLASAAHFSNAPETTRLGVLREQYFDYHMERRENRKPESFAKDFALCDVLVEYFENLSQMRRQEEIPVPAALRTRLSKSTLFLEGASTDLLMSYAILRDRPKLELISPDLFDDLCGWYLSQFMSRRKVPGSCVSGDLLAVLNTVDTDFPAFGVALTRFAVSLCKRSESRKERFNLSNGTDAILLILEIIATELPQHLHYRALLKGILPDSGADSSFLDKCIAALAAQQEHPPRVNFTALLHDRGGDLASSRKISSRYPEGAAQDILLIGHEGEGSGLGRNSRMLAGALAKPSVRLLRLSYDASAADFTATVASWLEGCRTPPIVLAAINAQDIPTLFVKDRQNSLDACYVIGFFLWETSLAPRVQHLGIRLVNEVWTPTRYVGDVYASLAPVHVVGKGLFDESNWPEVAMPSAEPLRFLTVFDFHSSIERKNPLAVVLAFQKAFSAGDKVQLIVKASNVNPQHPGNASRQWERLCAAAKKDARIRIITERYSEEQMQRLMRRASCVVSLHRSEGFGYVVSDAMALGIPVIATHYSGNVDFCDSETSFPVDYRLIPVNSYGAHWEGEGTLWADPDIDSAAANMTAVYHDYPAALAKATIARKRILERYSMGRFAATLEARLAAIRHRGLDRSSDRVH